MFLCKTSPPYSLQTATPVQTIVSPESARESHSDVDRSPFWIHRANGGWSGVIDEPSAHVCICRVSAVTVRIRRDTELHEQPPFPHRATTKPGVRACMSTWKRCESTDNSRKSVFPQLWIWLGCGCEALLVPPLRPISALCVCTQHRISDKWRVIHD